MSDWYELIGQTPVKIEGDIIECALRFEQVERRVKHTKLFDMCLVSTVFLGLDHSWRGGPPILFETMAFWRGEHGDECERCSTWPEAEAQHARMCAEVVRPAAVLAYVLRTLKEWWQAAIWDFRYRWREFRGIELTEMERFCQNFNAMEDNW